jgi:hypothetical protein
MQPGEDKFAVGIRSVGRPAIARASADTMKAGFRNILGFVRDKVLQQPSHEAFLANIRRSQRFGGAR